MDRQLLVIGAGGHAKVVIDVARAAGWNPVACLDPVGPGFSCAGVPVLGNDDLVAGLFDDGLRFAVVAIGANRLRLTIGQRLHTIGYTCPTIVHPSATLSAYSEVASGTVVMPGAIINSHARIGQFAIVNTGAIVEHDCNVGDGAHIAPRTVMGGNVRIGELTLFGIGSVARPEISIGARATVGAGSVVVSAVADGEVVAGVPAKPLRGAAA